MLILRKVNKILKQHDIIIISNKKIHLLYYTIYSNLRYASFFKKQKKINDTKKKTVASTNQVTTKLTQTRINSKVINSTQA